MELGLVGLGKMGGNMRQRIRNAGHTVVGFDNNQDISDSKDLADMVGKLTATDQPKKSPGPMVNWLSGFEAFR